MYSLFKILSAFAAGAIIFGAFSAQAASCSGVFVGGTGICYPNIPKAHTVLLGNDSGTISTTSPSTSGFIFTSNGVNADPTFQAPTGVTSAVAGTGIGVSSATGAITISNTGVTSIVAGTNITISGATGAVTINATGGGSVATSTAELYSTISYFDSTSGTPAKIASPKDGSVPLFYYSTSTTPTVSIGNPSGSSADDVGVLQLSHHGSVSGGYNIVTTSSSNGGNFTFTIPNVTGTGALGSQSSGLAYWKGTTVLGNIATTSVTCGTGTSCTSFTAIGASPVTITATGGSGLSTTTPLSDSNLLVYSVTGAGSAYGVATSTLTASSPLTGSFTQIGSGGSLGCQTASGSQAGCLSSTDWTTFNSKATFSGTIGQVNYFTGTNTAAGTSTLVIDTTSRVGIGSTTPGSLLSVHANNQTNNVNLFTIGSSTATATTTLFQVTNTGSTGIGSAPPPSTYLMVTPPSTPVFTFGFRVNNTNGTRAVGLNSLATYNGTTDQVTTAQGGGVNGGRYTATNQTVGNNVAMASGVSSQILVTGTLASTTNGVAYQIELPTVSTGNLLTNNYGAWVRGGTVSGTITNEAGIAIENQTTATNNSELLLGTATIPTGNYGVYQSDTYNNYFAGNVGVGTTTPYAALSVSGNFVLGGNITATSTATSTFTGGIAASDFCTATKCLSSAGGGGSSQWTGTSPGSIYYTTGNVGIGTTTPWAALSVSTTTQDSATAALFSVASTTNAALFTVLGNGRIGVGTTTTTYGTSSFTQAISNAATTIGGLLINTATNVANAFSIVNSSGTNVFNVDTTASNPFLGIGTTTPWGTLSVVGDGTDPILAVATSTNSGKPSFEIDQLGHVVTSGKTPVISSCGTGSPTAAGNDTNFRITTGTSASVCTATFANSYTNAPICIGTEESNGSTAVNASSTASNVVFSFGASLTIKQIAVHCEVYQ